MADYKWAGSSETSRTILGIFNYRTMLKGLWCGLARIYFVIRRKEIAGQVKTVWHRGITVELSVDSTEEGHIIQPADSSYKFQYICQPKTITIEASTPDNSCKFDGWTGDIQTVANANDLKTKIRLGPIPFKTKYAVTASFSKIIHTLTIKSAPGGTITAPGQNKAITYDEGDVVTLIVTPDTGYDFDGWSGDISTISTILPNIDKITMNGDYVITPEFKKKM